MDTLLNIIELAEKNELPNSTTISRLVYQSLVIAN